MIRPHGRRLGALFLLTAFLAGGFGLSDLDAFLFHSNPHGARGDAAHLEQPGGCGAHSERCVLAVATANAAVAASAPVKVRLSPLVFAPQTFATPVHRPITRGSLQYSRAPPRASAR
jgi:hypothetical protein